MFGICTCCCNGCPSRSQGSFRFSFPKKLLVATSVLVIIAMYVLPAEARTMEHRIRHDRRHESLSQSTKEMSRLRIPEAMVVNKRRSHRKQTTKDSPYMTKLRNATKKIILKIKNTSRFLDDERTVLNETREYGNGKPSWLPSINFVDIHFHNYRGQRKMERKFSYVMPKLLKSLVEFHEIFKRLSKTYVEFPDEPFSSYNKSRFELIKNTIDRLNSTIGEVKDDMISVNFPVPQLCQNPDLTKLELKVDAPQCFKYDYIAFRAYRNLLNNWNLEFKCAWGNKVNRTKRRCLNYEAGLKKKKDEREKRITKERKHAPGPSSNRCDVLVI